MLASVTQAPAPSRHPSHADGGWGETQMAVFASHTFALPVQSTHALPEVPQVVVLVLFGRAMHEPVALQQPWQVVAPHLGVPASAGPASGCPASTFIVPASFPEPSPIPQAASATITAPDTMARRIHLLFMCILCLAAREPWSSHVTKVPVATFLTGGRLRPCSGRW